MKNSKSQHCQHGGPNTEAMMLFDYQVDSITLSTLQEQYQKKGYLALPRLASSRLIDLSRQHVQSQGVRSVFLNPELSEERWGECILDESSPLFEKLNDPNLIAFLFGITGLEYSTFSFMKAWINVHQLNEFVATHTDFGGMQCLICLEQTLPENGGSLYLKFPDGDKVFSFAPGDGFIFKATEIPHYTSPLIATPNCQHPRRMMLVMRYYQRKT